MLIIYPRTFQFIIQSVEGSIDKLHFLNIWLHLYRRKPNNVTTCMHYWSLWPDTLLGHLTSHTPGMPYYWSLWPDTLLGHLTSHTPGMPYYWSLWSDTLPAPMVCIYFWPLWPDPLLVLITCHTAGPDDFSYYWSIWPETRLAPMPYPITGQSDLSLC